MPPDLDELLKSHDELRGALIMAARRIRTLTPRFGGRADIGREDPALAVLRQVLRDARIAARAYRARVA